MSLRRKSPILLSALLLAVMVAGSALVAGGRNGATDLSQVALDARSAAGTPRVGDVNGDGRTDLLDLIRLRDIARNRGAAPSASEARAADLNGDGRVDATDLDALRQMLLQAGTRPFEDVRRTGSAASPDSLLPSFAPTSEEVASALGLSAADILGFQFLAISGDSSMEVRSATVASEGGGIHLFTGLAQDDGSGDTDLLDDGRPDSTVFQLVLRVPPEMKSLLYSSRFATTEFESDTTRPDCAIVTFSTGAPQIVLGLVGQAPVTFPLQVRAVDVSGLDSLTVTFVVADAVNGNWDSALRLSHFRFTLSSVMTADHLATALLHDPELGTPFAPNLAATSGSAQIVDVVSAASGGVLGSVLLTSGLASGGGLGDTDLADDQSSDTTVFSLGLEVPQDGTTKSLVFTTQFLTSELGVPSAERGTDYANLRYERVPSGSGDLDLGNVEASSGAEQPPVTRAVDVEGAQQVRLTFRVSDRSDQGRRDSGLLISGLYFSEFDADLLARPRPADAKLHTGTYAYTKTLLAASGSWSPFAFVIHYDSAPRRTSGRMGPRWGHGYDWGVTELKSGDLEVRRGDGSIETFERSGDGYVPSHGRIVSQIRKLADGSYLYETTDQMRYGFDTGGRLTTITDRNENAVELRYTPGGLLSEVVDTRGQTATFTYDSNQLLTDVRYASRQVTLRYDSSKDLVSFTEHGGGTTSFTYGNHDLLTGTDANAIRFVTNTYDDLHRVVTQVDGKNSSSANTYTATRATHTDRVGNQVATDYDPLDRPVALTDSRGGVRRYTYDENDNRASETDPLGATFRTTYDGRGNALEALDPLGGLTRTTYDARNQPTEIEDEAGKRRINEYDERGNFLRTTNPLSFTRSFAYDGRGLLERATDGRGNVTRLTYTEAGDVATTTDPLDGVTRSTYDEMGRAVATYDPNGHGAFFAFDASGRPTAITDALGGVRGMSYDPEGRLLSDTDPLGATSRYRYSPTGRLVEVTDPSGAATRFEYNGEDKLIATVDPLGRRTSHSYDSNLQLIGTVDALGGRLSAACDAACNCIDVTDPNGHTSHFDFDAMGRCVGETDPLGGRVSNVYDVRGRVTSITNARGQTIACEYDDAARLSLVHRPDGDVTHVLDSNGNRVTTVGSDGTRSERAYDALNRLVHYTDIHGNTIGYQYDAAGNLLALTYSDGATVRYTYDALDRLTGVTDWEGRTTSYEYDAAGRLVSAHLPDGANVRYQYDAAGRLLTISDTAPSGGITFGTRYTLGPSGLRVAEEAALPLEPPVTTEERSFVHNAANQIASDGNEDFTYDADGNMTHGVVGRVPLDLDFDAMGQLVSAGASRYTYDHDGLRVGASVNGWTVQYVQDPSTELPRVLEEHDAQGRIVARYVYGLGLISRHQLGHGGWRRVAPRPGGVSVPDTLALQENGDLEEHVSVYHFDSRGSTVALTNLRGEITDRYAYDPYGLVVARDGDTPNPYTYNGRDGVVDDGNGLYFMRSRYYEPRLMRFVSRDGLTLGTLTDTQSLNGYAFVLGNPIHGVDPGGQWFGIDDAIMAIGGAVAGLIGQFVSDLIAGEWSGWEAYTGAAIGGAVWGETMLYTGNPWIAGAAGAAAGNGLTQGLQLLTGKREAFDPLSFFAEVGVGTATGGLGKFVKLGNAKLLTYAGRSWASRGFASSSKAAWAFGKGLVQKRGLFGVGIGAGKGFLRWLARSGQDGGGTPEEVIWEGMGREGRSPSDCLIGVVRPQLLLRTYAPMTAMEGAR